MSSLQIKGLQKTSLIDYAPYMSCVIFLAGCNFRCPFCQNPNLIAEIDKTPTISKEELLSFLQKRKKWLEGVVITGGEPCMNEDLPELIKKIKELGYKVKLDTNGANPAMIKELINKKLIDYVAMDIKGPWEEYDKIANVKVDKEDIQKSIDIIKNSGINYELRMTVVPTLIKKEDFEKIGDWLKGSKKFVLQQFRNKICLDKSFENIKPYSKEQLLEFKKLLEPYFDEVEVRGV